MIFCIQNIMFNCIQTDVHAAFSTLVSRRLYFLMILRQATTHSNNFMYILGGKVLLTGDSS
jgi:hypothetical protein